MSLITISVLTSILYNISHAWFLLIIVVWIYFLPFLFHILVSSNLICFSWRQHIIGFWISIHSSGLCLLIVKFNPLKCNIITNEVRFMFSILFDSSMSYIPFVPLSFNYCFFSIKEVFLLSIIFIYLLFSSLYVLRYFLKSCHSYN